MKTLFEPMLGLLGLGGTEVVILLASVIFFVVVLAVLAVVVIVLVSRNQTPHRKNVDLPPAPPSPIVPKTAVMPRKCPQCGTALPPDAPEGICPSCLLQRGFGTEGGGVSGQPSFVPPPIPELAKLFPQLEILECLGRGGMGAVYKARQPRLDRFVALKILAPEKQNDLQFAERFEREARALARLNHPNIVTVFDFGEVSGRFYLLMEFVDGLTLRQLLQSGKMAPSEALGIVPKICEAVQFAHEQGIVHRDIKPENILLDKQGRVKIADFGIAKITGLESKDFSLTGVKDIMGTPHYMAPEQVEKPQTVDHRADIYSLGVVFYEMLTGELPLGKFASPSQKVHVDVRLDEVVLHALEKEPARRYQQANQVKTAVETIAGTPAEFADSPTAPGSPSPSPSMAAQPVNTASDKTILPAFLLAFFFGVFGAHRFYVGKIATAAAQLCAVGFCVLLIIACATLTEDGNGETICGILLGFAICGCIVWATIDWLLIVCGAFKDGQGRRITNWIQPGARTSNLPGQSSAGGNAGQSSAVAPSTGDRSAMITAPAVVMMIGAAWKLFSALIAIFVLSGIGGWLNHLTGLGNIIGPWGSVAIFSIVLFKVFPGLLILFGAYQMLQRRSYAWALAAAIVSILACSLIGFPAGIWALIVLARADVKSAFGTKAPAGPLAPPSASTGRSFATIAGWVILILLGLGLVTALAVAFVPEARSAIGLDQAKIFGGLPPSPVDLTPAQLNQAGIIQGDNGEYWKNTTQSFPLNADGHFSLDDINGHIQIHGWSSNTVVITSAIHGRTAESVAAVNIKIDPRPDRVSVHTDQPSSVTGFSWIWSWFKNGPHNDANVDYIVQVPLSAALADISSVNGSINIDGVTSDITANTVNGDSQIDNAAGNLKISTVNGRINAGLHRLGSGQTVSLNTVNGRIDLSVPEAADATFSVTTLNGGITSDFPALAVKNEFPVSKTLKGNLGSGAAGVKISTVNGGVAILKVSNP